MKYPGGAEASRNFPGSPGNVVQVWLENPKASHAPGLTGRSQTFPGSPGGVIPVSVVTGGVIPVYWNIPNFSKLPIHPRDAALQPLDPPGAPAAPSPLLEFLGFPGRARFSRASTLLLPLPPPGSRIPNPGCQILNPGFPIPGDPSQFPGDFPTGNGGAFPGNAVHGQRFLH